MAPLHNDTIPPLLRDLIDDAAVFPPGNADTPDALRGHREYRRSWYAPMVGPLLLPVSRIDQVPADGEPLDVGFIADTGIDAVTAAMSASPERVRPAQVEAPAPDAETLRALESAAERWNVPVFAEIPIDRLELLDGFDSPGVTPKFRTGGLSATAFPTPRQLATAIVECVRHDLRFKLTAGLHNAVRHTDPTTGFIHHGFVNVLLATIRATAGDSVDTVTRTLEITQSKPLGDALRGMLGVPRPTWVGFGSCSITEPLDDLTGLSLLHKPDKES